MISVNLSRIYFPGLFYDWILEPFLRSIRKNIARLFLRYDLFPALDICCGAGKQCHVINLDKRNVIGLDRNLNILKYARTKYPDIPVICADASRIPIKNSYFKGILISYSLHDKASGLRPQILAEAKRLLTPDGKIILVDFEQPWNGPSRVGGLFTSLIERMAGGEHFRNGRQFLRDGGLRAFLKNNQLVELRRFPIEAASSAIVVATFSG
jgi:SAM-dependent methyltransferase